MVINDAVLILRERVHDVLCFIARFFSLCQVGGDLMEIGVVRDGVDQSVGGVGGRQ